MITGSKKTQRKSTTIQPRLWRRKKEQGGFVLVVMGLAAFALLGALLLAWLFSQAVSRPVVELRDVARALAAKTAGT